MPSLVLRGINSQSCRIHSTVTRAVAPPDGVGAGLLHGLYRSIVCWVYIRVLEIMEKKMETNIGVI